MQCDVMIKAEEFKDIHNGLWRLGCAIRDLEDTVHPKVLKELSTIEDNIRSALKGAYEQEHQEYERQRNLSEKVQEERKFRSIWSANRVMHFDDFHPFEGAKEVVYRSHWGPNPVRASINGDTWVDLWQAADECIRNSEDEHHIFIEHFDRSGDRLILHTGS